jgi:hypothetical protein
MQLAVDGETAITLPSAAAKSAQQNAMHTFGHGIHSCNLTSYIPAPMDNYNGGRLKMHI